MNLLIGHQKFTLQIMKERSLRLPAINVRYQVRVKSLLPWISLLQPDSLRFLLMAVALHKRYDHQGSKSFSWWVLRNNSIIPILSKWNVRGRERMSIRMQTLSPQRWINPSIVPRIQSSSVAFSIPSQFMDQQTRIIGVPHNVAVFLHWALVVTYMNVLKWKLRWRSLLSLKNRMA